MSDTTGQIVAAPRAGTPLRAGSNALGIVPATVEDVWRIAKYVVMGKMAPDALTKNRSSEEQASAVSTIILSGLELGLPPMVALRSFGMINNRPGLYGDGLINVCRRHNTCEFIKMGFERNNPARLLKLGKTEDEIATMEENELTYGWCHAKRRDTGEEAIVIFTKQDALDANLWDDRPQVMGTIWENGNKKQGLKPNDAPWFRYKPRMMQWRAAGYNLRNLFADVLGGMPSMDELQEVFGDDDMRDVTPAQQITRSAPPPPPPEGIDEEAEADNTIDHADFMAKIEDACTAAENPDALIEAWDALDVEATLTGDEDALAEAFDIRNKRLALFNDEGEGDEGK